MRLGPIEKRVLSALSELGGGVYLPRLGGYVHRGWQPDGRYVVPPDLTTAERTSLRRAVASLERKGLVEGFTMWDGQDLGLSEVWLTPDGLDLAESLRWRETDAASERATGAFRADSGRSGL